MNESIGNSRHRVAAGFGWPERALGGLLALFILVIALAFGVLILGVVVAGALVLAVRVWWWRRRLRQSRREHPMTIEGEYRVLESRRTDDQNS